MAYYLSIRQACKVVALSRNAYYHQPSEPEDEKEIENKLTTLAEKHHRWGFWKLFRRFRKQHKDLLINHKRLYRIYCKLKLNLPRTGKRRLPGRIKQPLTLPQMANWYGHLTILGQSDFMSDALIDGRRFALLMDLLPVSIGSGLMTLIGKVGVSRWIFLFLPCV
jgi:putative transposase